MGSLHDIPGQGIRAFERLVCGLRRQVIANRNPDIAVVEKEITMKQRERARPLTLDRPPPLNGFRSIAVAVAVCVAFAAAVYLAIG
jgi:hypothetical protein